MREFDFIPETVPGGMSMTNVNNIATDFNTTFEYLKELHTKVIQYKCPNYKRARVPVPSGWVVPAWQLILHDYHIPLLAQYLQFVFPSAS